MIIYKRRGLPFAEFHFEEPETTVNADLSRHLQRPVPDPKADVIPFSTRVIDPKLKPEELLADMNRHTRQTIRRCERESFFSFSLIHTQSRRY